MFLIVGLGNPGQKYQKTWHNIGFLAVDFFSREKNFPYFKLDEKLKSEISEGSKEGKKIILAKPQTFMNSSGSAVILLMKRWKIKDSDLLVLQDDIDLPFGKIRISRSRGTAGHNGVESIMKVVGTKDFTRIRIGIQSSSGKPRYPEKFVLQKIDKEGKLKDVFRKTDKAIEMMLEGRVAEAMSEYNK